MPPSLVDVASANRRYNSAPDIADVPAGLSTHAFLQLLLSVAVLAVAATLTLDWAYELSAFAFGLAKIALGLLLFYLVDKFMLKGFNTIQELKNANIAVSIVVVGFLGLIGLALALS